MRALVHLPSLMLAPTSVAERAPTVQTLLARHAQALGPLERVASRRLHLRIIGMAPFELPVVVEMRRPNLIRKEVSIQGSVQVTVFDGKQSWKTDPLVPDGGKPMALAPEEAKVLLEEADFDGALIRPDSKGVKVRYMGPSRVAGRPAHKLRVILATGAEATVWFDAGSYLEVKRTQMGPVMGQTRPMDILTSDYRLVDGVKVAHKLEIGLAGAKEKVAIMIDTVELNAPIDGARFAKPVAN